MAYYWKSPYSKTNGLSAQPDGYNRRFSENGDSPLVISRQMARFQTHNVCVPLGVQRQLFTHSAGTRQDSAKPKGILKTSNEQQKNDPESLRQHPIMCHTPSRNSANSMQLKKRVTFEKSLVNEESSMIDKISPQINTPWMYQPRLKLYQTQYNMATYNLKRLLGNHTANVSSTVQRKLTVPVNQVVGPVDTNGQCRHSVILKCSSCFKKTPEEGLTKEMENRTTDLCVLGNSDNKLLGNSDIKKLDNSDNKMTDLCKLSNSEKNVVSENKERVKVQDENIPCKLINVESNTPTPEQKTDLTPQFSQPWSDTVIFLHRWKNSTSARNCSSGLEESSGNNYLGKDSSDLLQNLEILSKLTVTADGKIKSMKTEDNTVLRKISDNPKNSMNSFHNFKFPQKTSATKLNLETNADQDVSIQFPKLTWT